ncbi:MAG: hypothetical protein OEN01_13040 [Candidatus Krumholzibacteria bacterium]|nr:hypothetical protein [Candidatus Krumholzibacteria bacterium]
MRVLYGLSIGVLALGTAALLGAGTSQVMAYSEYAQGCQNCHGDFRAANYVSIADGQAWGTSLHNGHRSDMLNGDCAACHTTPGFSPVFLKSSDGGDGLAPLGCLGCHGRDESSGVTGAGLRQHHWNNGVTGCGGCHPGDSNPAVFTPASEVVLPPYYLNPGANHPNMPTHPCNLESLGYPEDVLSAAGTGGLDNNGDNLYDTTDVDCAPLVPVEQTTWGYIKALYQ